MRATNSAVRGLAAGDGRRDWRYWAACRDEDPELFFPVGTSGPALRQIAQAKTVCRRCPVNTECLTWALAAGEDAGVWGGQTEEERRAAQRRRTRARARVDRGAAQ
jgi:WhiB family transcriptional regulator, redox-sensing transcriptional regulator